MDNNLDNLLVEDNLQLEEHNRYHNHLQVSELSSDQIYHKFNEFLDNPFTKYFTHLLEQNAEGSIEQASDPTRDLTSERILKMLGSAQGAKLFNTLVQSEMDYITNNHKPQ